MDNQPTQKQPNVWIPILGATVFLSVIIIGLSYFTLMGVRISQDVVVQSLAQSAKDLPVVVGKELAKAPTPVPGLSRAEVREDLNAAIQAIPPPVVVDLQRVQDAFDNQSSIVRDNSAIVQENTKVLQDDTKALKAVLAQVQEANELARRQAILARLSRVYEAFCLPPGGNHIRRTTPEWKLSIGGDTLVEMTPEVRQNLEQGGTCTITLQFRQDFVYTTEGSVRSVWVDTDAAEGGKDVKARGSQLWVEFGPGEENFVRLTVLLR